MPAAKSTTSMDDTNGLDDEEVRTKHTFVSALAGAYISSKVYGANAEDIDTVPRCFPSKTTLKLDSPVGKYLSVVRAFLTVVEATVADSPDVMKSLSPTHFMLLASTPDNDVPQSMFTPEIDHACMNHYGVMMMMMTMM
ncbi:hypothetical protein F2Q70_00012241 [Brassica cretica]|uniref:Uncharacterized protein n=1 Tax=Brassica cretica TaxID=69181 RepID=A0A8S9J5V1_BRACR|nr:hypothetical protein F2Q68_00005379 [Brassica cretica]KAF2613682.1 hypothetical protein F2Q70_00012241 [Brassica cretica]